MPKRPVGVITSSSSPDFSSSAAQFENAPPSTFFTRDAQFAIVGPGADRIGTAHFLAVHRGAQGEVLARREAVIVVQFLRDRKRHRDGVSGFAAQIVDGETVKARCDATWSMTLEIVERFAAGLAAPQRLAGGRAELGQQLGIGGAALRTGDVPVRRTARGVSLRPAAARCRRRAACRGRPRSSSRWSRPATARCGWSAGRSRRAPAPVSISSAIMFMAGQPE